MQETPVLSLGQEDPLEKEMATHSRILAWRIPWTEEPGGPQFMGSQRVGHDWLTKHFHFFFHIPGKMFSTLQAYVTYFKSHKNLHEESLIILIRPMDCIPPGSSVHEILQTRILAWVAISFSRGSSQPGARTQVSRIAGRRFINSHQGNSQRKLPL